MSPWVNLTDWTRSQMFPAETCWCCVKWRRSVCPFSNLVNLPELRNKRIRYWWLKVRGQGQHGLSEHFRSRTEDPHHNGVTSHRYQTEHKEQLSAKKRLGFEREGRWKWISQSSLRRFITPEVHPLHSASAPTLLWKSRQEAVIDLSLLLWYVSPVFACLLQHVERRHVWRCTIKNEGCRLQLQTDVERSTPDR